jgi:hypothetical protein
MDRALNKQGVRREFTNSNFDVPRHTAEVRCADEEHRVTDNDKRDESTGDTTSAFTRADFHNELEASVRTVIVT